VRVAEPEIALTVITYVPAGVPTVVVVVALEPQPAWKAISAKNPTSSKLIAARRVRETLPVHTPNIANPNIGKPIAYNSTPRLGS
jgi:hypothetical protein